MKQIVIDVMDNGEVKIETEGFSGSSCLEESQFLKDILGTEISRQLSPVYYTQKQKKKKFLALCG